MSKSTEELLRGKGLLAELEDCRSEEEAINVLTRENLWGGVINYPELEELKESYKNSEIEADGMLSLSQLDKVAGGAGKRAHKISRKTNRQIAKEAKVVKCVSGSIADMEQETNEGMEYEAENYPGYLEGEEWREHELSELFEQSEIEHKGDPVHNEADIKEENLVAEAMPDKKAEENPVDIKEGTQEDKNEENSENNKVDNKEVNEMTVEKSGSIKVSRTDDIEAKEEQILEDTNTEEIEVKSTVEQKKEDDNEPTSDVREEKQADEAIPDKAVKDDNEGLAKGKNEQKSEETSEKHTNGKNDQEEIEAYNSTNKFNGLDENGQNAEKDNNVGSERNVFYVHNETPEILHISSKEITKEQIEMAKFIEDNGQLTAKAVERAIQLGGLLYVENLVKAIKECDSRLITYCRILVRNRANGSMVMNGGGNFNSKPSTPPYKEKNGRDIIKDITDQLKVLNYRTEDTETKMQFIERAKELYEKLGKGAFNDCSDYDIENIGVDISVCECKVLAEENKERAIEIALQNFNSCFENFRNGAITREQLLRSVRTLQHLSLELDICNYTRDVLRNMYGQFAEEDIKYLLNKIFDDVPFLNEEKRSKFKKWLLPESWKLGQEEYLDADIENTAEWLIQQSNGNLEIAIILTDLYIKTSFADGGSADMNCSELIAILRIRLLLFNRSGNSELEQKTSDQIEKLNDFLSNCEKGEQTVSSFLSRIYFNMQEQVENHFRAGNYSLAFEILKKAHDSFEYLDQNIVELLGSRTVGMRLPLNDFYVSLEEMMSRNEDYDSMKTRLQSKIENAMKEGDYSSAEEALDRLYYLYLLAGETKSANFVSDELGALGNFLDYGKTPQQHEKGIKCYFSTYFSPGSIIVIIRHYWRTIIPAHTLFGNKSDLNRVNGELNYFRHLMKNHVYKDKFCSEDLLNAENFFLTQEGEFSAQNDAANARLAEMAAQTKQFAEQLLSEHNAHAIAKRK